MYLGQQDQDLNYCPISGDFLEMARPVRIERFLTRIRYTHHG